MEIVLIIIAVFVVALFSVGIAYAISIYKQRVLQKDEFERPQKQVRPKAVSQPVVFQKHRSVGITAGNQQGSSSYDPMIAVAIASSDMSSSSSYSSGGYSGGSSCSSSDSSSSSSSDSSSCD